MNYLTWDDITRFLHIWLVFLPVIIHPSSKQEARQWLCELNNVEAKQTAVYTIMVQRTEIVHDLLACDAIKAMRAKQGSKHNFIESII